MSKITPVVVNEIEFYVSGDGKSSGMSQRGICLFTSMPRSSFQLILKDIRETQVESTCQDSYAKLMVSGAKKYPEILHPFLGKKLTPANLYKEDVFRGADVLDSEFCSAFTIALAYHAEEFKAKIPSNTVKAAKEAVRKFVNIGIHEFIKRAVGYIERKDEVNLERIMNELLVIKADVKEYKEAAIKYKAIRGTTQTEFNGADQLLDIWEETEEEPKEDGEVKLLEGEYTLGMWIREVKGLVPTHSLTCRMAALVANTYKSMAQRPPKKRKIMVEGKPRYNTYVYSGKDLAFLQVAWTQLMNQI